MTRQQGAALLLFFLLLFVGAASLLLAGAPANPELAEQRERARELNEAKEALLAYAVLYPDHYAGEAPGFFPCPNSDVPDAYDPPGTDDAATNDSPETECDDISEREGRLPRQFAMGGSYELTIPVGNIARQEFWYAISENYDYNPKPAAPHDAQLPGTLSVDGQGDIVAVILFPGVPLPAQTGRPSTTIGDYLEDENADSDTDFVTTAAGDFNDQLVYISRSEYATRVTARVVADLKKVLDAAYAGGTYPASITGAPGWFTTEWAGTTTYTPGATAQIQFAGCGITYTLDPAQPVAAKSQESC